MTSTQDKIICVTCPKGCTLDVTHDGQTVLKVDSGCKRGDTYARQELLDPRRMVTTTLRVIGSNHLLIPVVTSEAFPKGQIQELLAKLREMEVHAPIHLGDILVENALGTGISIIASRDVESV